MARERINMAGWIMKEHGVPTSRITVIEEDLEYKKTHNVQSRKIYWKCKCDCGKIFTASGGIFAMAILYRVDVLEKK